jgi:hypothetical protein
MSYVNLTPQVLKDMELPDLDSLTEGDMIALYIALRDGKAAYKKRFKEQMQDGFNAKIEALAAKMLGHLDQTKLKNMAGDAGTAYRVEDVSATIADKEVFRDHVTENHLWDLIDWRANKTQVRALVKANQPVPPGLNYSTRYVIGVRKAGER